MEHDGTEGTLGGTECLGTAGDDEKCPKPKTTTMLMCQLDSKERNRARSMVEQNIYEGNKALTIDGARKLYVRELRQAPVTEEIMVDDDAGGVESTENKKDIADDETNNSDAISFSTPTPQETICYK